MKHIVNNDVSKKPPQPRTQARFTDVKRPRLRLVTCQAFKIHSAARVSTGSNFVYLVYKMLISNRLPLLTFKVCIEILFLKRDLLLVLPTDYNKSLLHQILT